MSRHVGGGSPWRLPHSTQGAGDCKEKRLRPPRIEAGARFRSPAGVAMAAVRPRTRTYLDYNATAPLRPEARDAALVCDGEDRQPVLDSRRGPPRAADRRGCAGRGRAAGGSIPALRDLRLGRHGGGKLRAQSVFRRRGGRGAARAAHRRAPASTFASCPAIASRRPRSRSRRSPPTGGSIWTGSRPPYRRPGRVLLALQGANNETGVIQPVARRRRSSTRRAASSSATRCSSPAGRTATSRRSAPTRCRSPRTRSAGRKAQARLSRRARASASASR